MSPSKIDESIDFVPLGIAVLAVSDTRNLANDKSGLTLAERLEGAGHILTHRQIVKDDAPAIRDRVLAFIADEATDVVLTTGGTGFTGRDVTPEAVRPLFDKEIDGFSAIFHQISFQQIGTSTLQSRACAGLSGRTLIFVLPGSSGACKDAWDGILRFQLDSRHRPCNFVEIRDRFLEGAG